MIPLRVVTIVGLLAAALPATGVGQGLGDIAARERARREKEQQTKKVPVLTNEDLEKGRPPGAAPAAAQGASSATESADAPRETPPLEDRFAAERPYLDALKEAQTRASQLESRIQELGSKLNPMSGSFIYGPTGSNSANEEAEVRAQLRQAESELTEARQAVQAANQALQDFRQGRTPAPQ